MAEHDPPQPPEHRTAPQKCENCGGQTAWDAAAGAMKCASCGALAAAPVTPGARIVEYDLAAELSAARPKGTLGAGARQMRCSECGATVEFPDNLTAKKCEFCDSPAVLAEAARDDHYLPESLVPFAIDRAAAGAAFKKWLAKLWFRPSNLKEKADVTELHGVYVPYWTFDCDVRSRWTADAGYYYYVSESYTVTVNGKRETRTRQVRKIRWEPCSGQRHDHHDDHLVCASVGLPPQLATRMDEFQTSALQPYSKEFLQGFSAESYAIDLPEGWRRGQAEIADLQEARCAKDVPGDTQRHLRASHEFSKARFKHVLLPVWIAAFRYQQKVFRFLVNGQTGKVAGHAPWSITKIVLFVLLIAAVIAGLVLLWSRKSM